MIYQKDGIVLNINVSRVLITSAPRVSETMFLTPSLRLLKKSYPNIICDNLSLSPAAADVMKNNPYINKIWLEPSEKHLFEMAKHYDLAITLHDSAQSREYVRTLSLPVLDLTSADSNVHPSEAWLQSLAKLLAKPYDEYGLHFDLMTSPENVSYVDDLFLEAGIDVEKDTIIVLSLGGHSPFQRQNFWSGKKHQHRKHWPVESYWELIKGLSTTIENLKVVFIGWDNDIESLLSNESKDNQEILNKIVTDLSGQLSINDMAALFDKSHLFLSTECQLLHVACASQVPILALLRNSHHVRNGLYPKIDKHHVLVADELHKLSVSTIQMRALEILQNIKKRPFLNN